MSERAPMPPWWVRNDSEGRLMGRSYSVMGGSEKSPVLLFTIYESAFSNAKELADLIVQRTKQ